MDENRLAEWIGQTIVEELKEREREREQAELEIPIGVSNRHVHLSPKAIERLFGSPNALTKLRDLTQPGQYACRETVDLIGPKGRINRVRILGPARKETQVEISLFDGYTLGLMPPIRDSGDLEGTPGIILQGPRGQLEISRGVICAARHIHMHPSDAARLGVRDGQRVRVRVGGIRGLVFDNVLIRVSENFRLEMHIDLDEANAGNIRNGQTGTLLLP